MLTARFQIKQAPLFSRMKTIMHVCMLLRAWVGMYGHVRDSRTNLEENSETKDVESFADLLPYSGLDAGSRKLNSSLCPKAITKSDHSLITCRAHCVSAYHTCTRRSNVHVRSFCAEAFMFHSSVLPPTSSFTYFAAIPCFLFPLLLRA